MVASLYWARHVLIPVVLAILLTFTLSPLVNALQRLRLARALPTQRNAPIDSTEPKLPIEPMENADPTEPTEQNEPLLATHRNDPSDQSDHIDVGDCPIGTSLSRRYGADRG